MICQTFEVLNFFQSKNEKKGGYERFCSLGPHTDKILIRNNGISSYAGTAEWGR